MFTKRTLLALSISLSTVPIAVFADISQYNYDTQITTKEVGVDIQAVINCGSEYGINKDCETAPSNSAKAGYGQNSNVVSGSNDVRSLNKGQDLAIPPTTSKEMGFSSIDKVADVNYGKTRDIAAQQEILGDTYGANSKSSSADELKGLGINSVSSTGVDHKDSSTTLTTTYNTNKLSNAQGEAMRNKCLQPNPNRPAGSKPSDDSYYLYNDVQCLSVRTVSLTNDNAATSGFTKTDPLRAAVVSNVNKNKETNNKVINVNTTASNESTANQQSYACDLTPERTEYSNNTCQSKGVGRQQICQQKLTIMCGGNAIEGRDLPECVSPIEKGSIKMGSSSRSYGSFTATESLIYLLETWKDGSGGSNHYWTINFTVNNPYDVKMILNRVRYDNQIEITLNDKPVFKAQTGGDVTATPNTVIDGFQLGLNSLNIKLNNWAGPASASVSIAIDPSSFSSCQCKESWVKTCSIENVELQ